MHRLFFAVAASLAMLPCGALRAELPRAVARCGGLTPAATVVRDPEIVDDALEARLVRLVEDTGLLPGLAVSVVKERRVVYSRGFGYRDLPDCRPVDGDTRFYLKSTTKSFVGVLAALLHEEGVIELDAPITAYLPELSLPAPLNAGQIPLRAHLTHAIPYGNGGIVYRTAHPGNLPMEALVAHLNTWSEPKDTRFEYSNLGPIVAGHAMEQATGQSWRDLLEARVFAPAGMRSSFAHMVKAEAGPMAIGYVGHAPGMLRPTTTKVDAQMHPAGGSVSTVNDLARWLLLNLDDGRLDGEPVFPRRAVEQAHARQIQLDWTWYKFHRFAHGLGVYSADYEGELLMHHLGGETHVSFMPERGLGVAVLTNRLDLGASVSHAVAVTIYDALLGKPELDARAAAETEAIRQRVGATFAGWDKAIATAVESIPAANEVIGADALTGRYVNDRLGEIVVVEREDGSLGARFGVLEGPLEHARGNGYLADISHWGDPPELYVFRRDGEALVLDWGGRLFEHTR